MNREHFFTELRIQLKKIPLSATEKLDIIEKYEEKYDQKLQEGLSEEEISKELGSPKRIVAKIVDDLQLDIHEAPQMDNGWQEFSESEESDPYYQDYPPRHTSGFSRILQIAGLLCLNGLLMIWVFFTFYMLAFSGWLTAVLFAASPLLVVVSLIFQGFNPINFFLSLVLCGLGIIGIFILLPLTYFLWKLTKMYVKWNLNVLRGVY